MSWLDNLNPFYRAARRERDKAIKNLKALWDEFDDDFRRELMMFALDSLGAKPDWNAFYRAIRDIRDSAITQLEAEAIKQWQER